MNKLEINTEDLREVAFAAVKEKLASAVNYQDMREVMDTVMSERRGDLERFLGECLDSVLASPEMRTTLLEEFRHKMAKKLVADLEGTVEKATNAYRQNPTLKARLVVAIENIITEEEKKAAQPQNGGQ